MTSYRENETGSAPDERAPLLANENVRNDAAASLEGEEEPLLEPEKAGSKTWYYAWRGFWIVLAILVIAVFVKGWIDADDVNVSNQTLMISEMHLPTQP